MSTKKQLFDEVKALLESRLTHYQTKYGECPQFHWTEIQKAKKRAGRMKKPKLEKYVAYLRAAEMDDRINPRQM